MPSAYLFRFCLWHSTTTSSSYSDYSDNELERDGDGSSSISGRCGGTSSGGSVDGKCSKNGGSSDGGSDGGTSVCNGNGATSLPNRQ